MHLITFLNTGGNYIRVILDHSHQRNYHKSGRRQEVIKFILTQPAVLVMHGKIRKLIHKREAIVVKFFLAFLMKRNASTDFMDRANEEISKKISEFDDSEAVDLYKRSDIERDVMMELMGLDRPGRARGHGAGVTKSQVTNRSYDLRRMRGENFSKSKSSCHTFGSS